MREAYLHSTIRLHGVLNQSTETTLPLRKAKHFGARDLGCLMEPFHCGRLSSSHTEATRSTVHCIASDTVLVENILMCQIICIVN
jgi:hypothetical protein